RLAGKHLVDAASEEIQRLFGELRPVPRQAVVEEQVEKDAGVAAPRRRETGAGRNQLGMGIGEHVDAPVQADAALDFRSPATGQRPLDEIAVEAAQQLRRALAAQMQVGQVVHRRSASSCCCRFWICPCSPLMWRLVWARKASNSALSWPAGRLSSWVRSTSRSCSRRPTAALVSAVFSAASSPSSLPMRLVSGATSAWLLFRAARSRLSLPCSSTALRSWALPCSLAVCWALMVTSARSRRLPCSPAICCCFFSRRSTSSRRFCSWRRVSLSASLSLVTLDSVATTLPLMS